MGRTPRIDPIDGWHHVMNRGVDRSAIFFDDRDRLDFGRGLATLAEDHGIDVVAYCLMGNHFHVLIRCPDGGLSDGMQQLLSSFVRRVNHRHGRDGPLFRGRFRSRVVTSQRQRYNTFHYIHRNPLDIAGVTDEVDYRWSSARTYAGFRQAPDWLRTDLGMPWLGTTSTVAGADASPSAAELVDTVELVVAERSDSAPGRRRSEVRALSLALADDLGDHRQHDLVEHLEIPNAKALSNARSRARRVLDEPNGDARAMLAAARLLLAA